MSLCRVFLPSLLSLLSALSQGQSEFELTIPQGARSQVMVDVGGSVPTAKYWAVFDDESNMIAYDADPKDWDIDIVNTAPGTYKIVVESPYPIPLETYELWAWDESGGWASVLANIVPSQFLSLSDVTNESVNVSAASEAYQPSYARLELRKGTGAWTLAEQYVPVDDDPVQIDLEELDPNSDYTVRLSSFGASGQTDYATAQFHTKPDGPDQVGVFAVSDSSIAVYWSRVQGATAYKVYRASNLGQYNWGSPVAVITTNLNQPILKWVDTGLPSYSMRYYRVTAVVDGYQSQPSEEDCHYANPNALPWDQGLSSVLGQLDNVTPHQLFPIFGNAALISPDGEYFDPYEPTFNYNPSARDGAERIMFGPGVMAAPFTGDGMAPVISPPPPPTISPSDDTLFPDRRVRVEGAYTRRDAPGQDFIGFSGTFIFPARNNEDYFKSGGTAPRFQEGQYMGEGPANSLNMYVGWATPIPTSQPIDEKLAPKSKVAADIGLQFYPASDATGNVVLPNDPENENPSPPPVYPHRYIPFLRVNVDGKDVLWNSPQLNNGTVFPTRRYLDATSPLGWLFATIRVAYSPNTKLVLYQIAWGRCDEYGLNKSPETPHTLAAPWSGPFYGPTVNVAGIDTSGLIPPFEFGGRMTSRRVVSVAQRNRSAGPARALNFYFGENSQKVNPINLPYLWTLMPWGAWSEDSYAHQVKMLGWDCLGYSNDWFSDPFETSGVGGGTYLRTTRHDLGTVNHPFGTVYDAVDPLLDSITSIDHRTTP